MRAALAVIALLGLAAAGCVDTQAQARERGVANLQGTWRIASYQAGDAKGADGGYRFEGERVEERLVLAKAGGGRVVRRERARAFRLEAGRTPGSYVLVFEGGERVLATFTPGGRLLLLLPAEVGNGWAALPARIELEKDAPEPE